VEVNWDGLSDPYQLDRQMVQDLVGAGAYHVRGLYHTGLGAEYEMTFYNPGTPPWDTRAGTGAWGADHAAPRRVARAGDGVILSWAFAEGGSGIIGLNDQGRKIWGEKRGGLQLAADGDNVYAVPADWHTKAELLVRLDRKTGAYKPFTLDGKPRPFELPTATIFGKDAGTITALAAGEAGLAVSLNSGKIMLLDRETAEVKKQVDVPSPGTLAFGPNGELYARLNVPEPASAHGDAAGGDVHRIDFEAGKATPISTPGLGRAAAIAVDNDGNILVADVGPDSQVKAYSPAGKLVYTAGKKGGRPIRGDFDPQAMLRMSSVAVDAQGQIWVVESWNFPRRVSVWGKDGKLVRDYIGNTGYAGTGSMLHETDPTLAYVGPIELKLNK